VNKRRRIWITGIGLITPIGTGVDAFRAGLRTARSPVKRIDRFDPSPFRSQVAAQLDDFDPLAWMPPKTARQLDRFSQFGLVAGRLALDDAGLTPGENGAAAPERIGI
jgi:3-oxoacyl-[acyl-carrier-protein] synthase II